MIKICGELLSIAILRQKRVERPTRAKCCVARGVLRGGAKNEKTSRSCVDGGSVDDFVEDDGPHWADDLRFGLLVVG